MKSESNRKNFSKNIQKSIDKSKFLNIMYYKWDAKNSQQKKVLKNLTKTIDKQKILYIIVIVKSNTTKLYKHNDKHAKLKLCVIAEWSILCKSQIASRLNYIKP